MLIASASPQALMTHEVESAETVLKFLQTQARSVKEQLVFFVMASSRHVLAHAGMLSMAEDWA